MHSTSLPTSWSSLPDLSASLVYVGAELFNNGLSAEAEKLLDIALAIGHAPGRQMYDAAAKLLQEGTHALMSEHLLSSRKDGPAPDLYQEDECDVGPRILDVAVVPDLPVLVSNTTFLRMATLFNKALVCHSLCRDEEAKELYQAVVCILQHILTSPSTLPSNYLMQLGMRVQNNLGLIYYHEGEEDIARASFEASILFAQYLGESTNYTTLEYASVLSNWCRVSWMRGDINDKLYNGLRAVLRIRSAVLDANHSDVAAAHYNVAVAEYARQQSCKALAHLWHYLQICAAQTEMDQSDLSVLPALIYIVLIKNEDKDDNMSQELVRALRTLQEKRQDHGPHTSEVAAILNYVGTLLFHQEDFENALLFFQEELRLEESLAVGKEDISVSVTCNNIGRILQELGKYRKAIVYYHRALKAEYGDIGSMSKGCVKCPVVDLASVEPSSSAANLYSTVWYNLGLIKDKLGACDDAIFAFEMSLGLRRAMLGPDHPDIACLLYNIGVLRMERQQLKEASLCFREALGVRRAGSAGQLNDRHVVRTLEKLSSLYKAKGDIQAALECAQEVLRIQQSSTDYDEDSRRKDEGATLRCIAELYQAVSDLESSMKMASASVCKLRLLVAQTKESDTPCYLAIIVEQLVSSLLLLGSLCHETCEPFDAQALFVEAANLIQQETLRSRTPASFYGLREVTLMLASGQCAPMA